MVFHKNRAVHATVSSSLNNIFSDYERTEDVWRVANITDGTDVI